MDPNAPGSDFRDDLYEVTLIVNGSLCMSVGKMVGQAFQAAARFGLPEATIYKWREHGTRTIVRVAKTPAIFSRICAEVPGQVMRDEGFTEVEPDTPTVFISDPYLHRDRPKLLENKKVPLL